MEINQEYMERVKEPQKHTDVILSCEHLKKTYNKGKDNALEVLKDVSLQIQRGEMIALMGKSGSGKSTLMHILSGMIPYDSGTYHLDQEKIEKLDDKRGAFLRNEKFGIVMQNFALIDEFTALENVMLPLDFNAKMKKGKKERALEVLEKVHMKECEKQLCKTMSGGQKQRVAIARAIVNEPLILMADEATGALDRQNCEAILELFKQLNQEGLTILLITHDPWVAQQCDRIITIEDGKIK